MLGLPRGRLGGGKKAGSGRRWSRGNVRSSNGEHERHGMLGIQDLTCLTYGEDQSGQRHGKECAAAGRKLTGGD